MHFKSKPTPKGALWTKTKGYNHPQNRPALLAKRPPRRFDAKKGPRQRKPISKESRKRHRERPIYNALAKEFLELYPQCQAMGCPNPSTQCHHTRGRRGKNYLDMSTFMAVCAHHHDQIHQNPKWAKMKGYLFSFHA